MVEIKLAGGAALNAKLAELSKKLSARKTLNVGFLENEDYEDGTPVAMVAAIQEFGAPAKNIPPRPFFRTMVKKQSGHWGDDIGQRLVATGYDATNTLNSMGEEISAELQKSIVSTNSPPLSPVTVMLRGMRSKGVKITGKTVGEAAQRVAEGKTNYGASTKPLIDTGQMLRSVGHEIEE